MRGMAMASWGGTKAKTENIWIYVNKNWSNGGGRGQPYPAAAALID